MDNYQDHIGTNGRPDLGLYGVDTVPIEGFNSKVLLDPFKEQFDLPALFVIRGNLFGSSRFYVGKYDDVLIIFFIDHVYPTQDLRLVCFGFGRYHTNGLVAFQTLLAIIWSLYAGIIPSIFFTYLPIIYKYLYGS